MLCTNVELFDIIKAWIFNVIDGSTNMAVGGPLWRDQPPFITCKSLDRTKTITDFCRNEECVPHGGGESGESAKNDTVSCS